MKKVYKATPTGRMIKVGGQVFEEHTYEEVTEMAEAVDAAEPVIVCFSKEGIKWNLEDEEK